MLRISLVLSMVFVGLFAGASRAGASDLDICRAPLGRDAYRVDLSQYGESHYRSLTEDYLCSSRNSSSLKTQEAGIETVIPVYDIPIAGNWGSSKTDSEAESSCRQKIASLSTDDIDRLNLVIVDNKLSVQAFSACVAAIAGGLEFSIDPAGEVVPSSGTFVVIAKWFPPRTVTNPRPLSLKPLRVVGATCDKVEIGSGKKIEVNGTVTSTCKRNKGKAVTITLSTAQQLSATVTLPAVAAVPSPSTVGPCLRTVKKTKRCAEAKFQVGQLPEDTMPDKDAVFNLDDKRVTGFINMKPGAARLKGLITFTVRAATHSWTNSPYKFQIKLDVNGNFVAQRTWEDSDHSKPDELTFTWDISQTNFSIDNAGSLVLKAWISAPANWTFRSYTNSNPPDAVRVDSASFYVEVP